MSEKHAVNALHVALASGLWLGVVGALITVAALLGVPGYRPVADALATAYGPWGYRVAWSGVPVGAFYGFLEGFIHIGAVAWIYNALGRRRAI